LYERCIADSVKDFHEEKSKWEEGKGEEGNGYAPLM
jgi:hypothetical protein